MNSIEAKLAPLRPAMIALAALIALLVLGQGIGAPFEKDAEPQSAQWIASVVRDGRWLIPEDYYGAIDRKPPLFYWLAAAVAEISGGAVNEVNARAVSLAAGTALAVVVLAWTAANLGAAEGWLAFLFLLGIYGFSSRATLALTDMLMTLLAFGAYLTIFPLLSGAESTRRTIAAGALLGLAVLTKGPVAITLVALAAACFILMERRNPFAMLKRGWPWQIFAIALGIAACWYVPWLVRGGDRTYHVFLAENFGHFLPEKFGGTGEAARPIWYIAMRTIGGSLPIVAIVPAAIAALAAGEIAGERRRPIAFQGAFVLATIAFFSIASAKRDDYILPAMPPIAILCATAFFLGEPRAGAARWSARLRDGAVAAIAIAMLAALAAAWLPRSAFVDVGYQMQSSDAATFALFTGAMRSFAPASIVFIAATLAASVAALIAVRRRIPIVAGAAVGTLALAASLLLNASIRPALTRERDLGPFAAAMRAKIGDAPLFILHGKDYELSYYWGREIPPILGRRAVHPQADLPFYVAAREHSLGAIPPAMRSRMKPLLRAKTIGGAGPYTLYEIAPAAKPSAKDPRSGRIARRGGRRYSLNGCRFSSTNAPAAAGLARTSRSDRASRSAGNVPIAGRRALGG
ncbi:MAG: ArnT family glycosyltransferase [Candidatus Binataceae bacterium]